MQNPNRRLPNRNRTADREQSKTTPPRTAANRATDKPLKPRGAVCTPLSCTSIHVKHTRIKLEYKERQDRGYQSEVRQTPCDSWRDCCSCGSGSYSLPLETSWPVEHLMADPPGLDKFAYRVRDLRGQSIPMSRYETSQRNIVLQGGCFAGQLTSLGKKQLYDLGQRLRKEYVDGRKCIPGTYNADDIYVRSTNIIRTVESALWLVSGLCGLQKSGSDSAPTAPDPIEIFASTEEEEILYPNYPFCNDLGRLLWSSWCG
ncbi:putative Lysophosphatidic acid phosphatase type 6 [Hypsibius exemplaris]|uniref:Lysophosphatidic acid phosphatase type 6 n=1 Tax=Hypsibius exemplaris TaxID=2072580 RepID=A0A1W0XFL7_HYPEX|nr:putative Lysophosphatidic acid phosphatase type 6 [Hypsibius exemplaris]